MRVRSTWMLRAVWLTGVAAIVLLVPSTALASGGWSGPVGIDVANAHAGNYLSSVSCPSASFCAAVDIGGDALTYNGSSWSAPMTIDSSPTPGLPSVSCASASFCVAVGTDGNGYTYTGSSWSGQGVGSNTGLNSVSCLSASFCATVGNDGNAHIYTGSSWTLSTVDSVTLYSVSCPTSSFCAVVSRDNAYTYNSGSWSKQAGIDTNSSLVAVSCASASFCVAVDGGGDALTYNGSSWSAPRNVNSTGEALTAVSCSSASFCAATGDNGNAYTYNGSSWNEQAGVAKDPLISVSCPSASFCVALDQYDGNAYMYTGTGPLRPPVRTCQTPNLRLSLVRILGAAGRRSWDLALSNRGSATCTLRGYPAVGVLDRHGHVLRVRVARRRARVTTVTLTRGQRAFFTFSFESGGPCVPHVLAARGLLVLPPGSRRALRLTTGSFGRFGICAPSLGGQPQVTPVRAALGRG